MQEEQVLLMAEPSLCPLLFFKVYFYFIYVYVSVCVSTTRVLVPEEARKGCPAP